MRTKLSPYAFPGVRKAIPEEMERRVETLEFIICRELDVMPSEIHRKSRIPKIVQGRQTVMYFARLYLKWVLADIGQFFTGCGADSLKAMDHTTVLHSIEKYQERLDTLQDSRDLDIIIRYKLAQAGFSGT